MENIYPRWRVGVTIAYHHVVELEAINAQTACEKSVETVLDDMENFRTGTSSMITSCLINDKNAKDYATYIPEFIEKYREDETY